MRKILCCILFVGMGVLMLLQATEVSASISHFRADQVDIMVEPLLIRPGAGNPPQRIPNLTLGLQHGATQDEIRAAFQRVTEKYHPDKDSSLDAKMKFHEARLAYDALIKG